MCMDDTTLAECVEKNGISSMQARVDEFVTVSSRWFPIERIEVQGTYNIIHKVREAFRAHYYQQYEH